MFQDAALVAMRSEVVAEVTKLRAEELEQAQHGLRQQLQQQVLHHNRSHCNKLLSSCIMESCGPAMPAVHMPTTVPLLMPYLWTNITHCSFTVMVYSTPQDRADF